MPRCPRCGCALQIRSDEDPYIDRYGSDDEAKSWFTGGLSGLLSLVTFIAFRLMPWINRHRWCPRCRMTVV